MLPNELNQFKLNWIESDSNWIELGIFQFELNLNWIEFKSNWGPIQFDWIELKSDLIQNFISNSKFNNSMNIHPNSIYYSLLESPDQGKFKYQNISKFG